ncbi:contact-dependent growth inhibition system immunity protein [Streptomyces sp. NPDC001743]|uniref:contact-dependent growth inhibition system immunity protein n=1 Tax=Streptomyces sp. NPDC001743 TaxID=3154397 RepID=UPI003324B8EF
MRHPAASADDTRLVTTAHALRRRTIGELTVEDMRLLIGPSSSFTTRQPEVGQSSLVESRTWSFSRNKPAPPAASTRWNGRSSASCRPTRDTVRLCGTGSSNSSDAAQLPQAALRYKHACWYADQVLRCLHAYDQAGGQSGATGGGPVPAVFALPGPPAAYRAARPPARIPIRPADAA